VANERLRSRITGARLTIAEVAAQVGVDPKTVERWIVLGRIPHRSHRWATASLLGADEAYLWPELADDRRTQAASTSELVTLYPNRGAVPAALWRSLLEAATDRTDVLVYAGLFLPDGYPEIAKLLATKAEQGTTVRLTLGDPTPTRCVGGERRNEALVIPTRLASCMAKVVLRWLANKIGCEDAVAGRPSEACLTSFASIVRVRSRGQAEAHRVVPYGSSYSARPGA
jgi:hypothetical protein